jgi:ribosomal protein S27AE
MELVQQILTDPATMRVFLITMAVYVVISLIVCFIIAKTSKLHIGYTAFGLIGTTGIFVVLCRSMAKSAGVSGYFMWLGLLGVYGVVIMAVVMIVKSMQRVKNQMNDMNNMNGRNGENGQDRGDSYHSGSNSETGSYSSDWERQYEEGRREREEQQSGYNLNGEHVEQDHGTICLNCGAAVAPGEKTCPRCGNKVK